MTFTLFFSRNQIHKSTMKKQENKYCNQRESGYSLSVLQIQTLTIEMIQNGNAHTPLCSTEHKTEGDFKRPTLRFFF